jgi:sugar phosphate isomerase/epimerase
MYLADPDRLSLCHGTMANVPAPDFVTAAHRAGFSRVSIRLASPSDVNGRYGGNAFARPVQADVRNRLQNLGLEVEEIEYAMLTPASRAEDFDSLLEGGAAMGARHVVTICYGFEEDSALLESFCGFCERAGAFGIGALLEFIAISNVPSLEAASRIVASAAGGAMITVDILHLIRSGGRIEDIGACDPSLIGMAQLCDGPMAAPVGVAAQRDEMRDERLHLGDGEFPLRGFIAAIPAQAPLGIEILRLAQPRDVEAAAEEAARIRRSALRILDRSG